jgi:hypothetical protein
MQTKLKLLVVTGLLTLSPAWLAAQTEVSPVLLDSRVRVTTHSAPGLATAGTLESWDGESFELVGSGFAPQTIPLSDLAKLEISRGKKGHWLAGTLIGAGLGIGVGLLVAAGDNVDDPASNDPFIGFAHSISEQGMDMSIVLVSTLAGAGLGALVGALIKTEKWEEVPIPKAVPQGPAAVARY